MRKYNYITENILLGDKTVKAHFPKTHSTVKGIAYSYERWDDNQGDTWANRTNMKERIRLYILWKKHKEWEKIVDGDKNTSHYQLSECRYRTIYPSSLNNVLFQFETKEIQRKYILRDEQKELKAQIKEYQKKLKKVEQDMEKLKSL
jgi:hypothetical protein